VHTSPSRGFVATSLRRPQAKLRARARDAARRGVAARGLTRRSAAGRREATRCGLVLGHNLSSLSDGVEAAVASDD